jgi:DNA-binding beta-propeller fold protein YncE
MYAITMFEDVCGRTRTADGIVIDRVKRPTGLNLFISITALTLLIWQLIFGASSVECADFNFGRAQAAATEPADAVKPSSPDSPLIRELQTPGPVSTLVWSSDGTKFAAGSLGKVITIWDSAGQVVWQIQRERAFFRYGDTFAFVSGGTQLATPPVLSEIDAFSLFDIGTGEVVREIPGLYPGMSQNINGAKVLVASPDRSILAVIFGRALDQPVSLFSTQNWNKVVGFWCGGDRFAQPSSVAFSRDGKRLAASEIVGFVWVYDLNSNRIIREIYAFPDRTPAATAIAFSPDGSMIALGSSGRPAVDRLPDGRIFSSPLTMNINIPALRVFNVDRGRLVAGYGNSSAITGITGGLVWSPDGLAFITGGRVLHIWNPLETYNSERIIDLGVGQRSAPIALSPNGTMLAVGVGQSVRVYQIAH